MQVNEDPVTAYFTARAVNHHLVPHCVAAGNTLSRLVDVTRRTGFGVGAVAESSPRVLDSALDTALSGVHICPQPAGQDRTCTLDQNQGRFASSAFSLTRSRAVEADVVAAEAEAEGSIEVEFGETAETF